MKREEVIVLIKHRVEQAQTALTDAQFLSDGNRSPQSIVNRSYYAMFYAALALMQNIGKVPSKHVGVISHFDKEFAAKEIFNRELSRDFHKAFEMRQVADYKIIEPVSREMAIQFDQFRFCQLAYVNLHGCLIFHSYGFQNSVRCK